jgi:hypothetical protein
MLRRTMISTASMRFCATFRSSFFEGWFDPAVGNSRPNARKRSRARRTPNQPISQGRQFPRNWSSLFFAPFVDALGGPQLCGYTGACGFHHARRIAKNSKKEKSFFPFPSAIRASLFAYATSANRDLTGAQVQQRHAATLGTQVEMALPKIKGRPALPAGHPFFIHVVRFPISDIVYYPFRNDSGN